ncbi:hypothetical protein VV02_08615 [Luteipulveratus mongoliensis]|uniref:DUF3592 domain-containing protein n=2 Tax=Luteipulveratus mongoliensis TaxID=571913 RepID=A0A0K1JGQ1_9MICO|nr:hypothetical protein VV02_08615 [Luteipulveratus mongoliensis]
MFLIGLAVVIALTGWIIWRRTQHDPPPDGMASTTVVRTEAKGDQTALTLRYRVDGRDYTATHEVRTTSYVAQGKVAWICFKLDEPGSSRVRLPLDSLC